MALDLKSLINICLFHEIYYNFSDIYSLYKWFLLIKMASENNLPVHWQWYLSEKARAISMRNIFATHLYGQYIKFEYFFGKSCIMRLMHIKIKYINKRLIKFYLFFNIYL